MDEWLKGFVSGITLGLVLAMLWDTFKVKKHTRRKEKKILSAIKDEISHNLETLRSNKNLIQEELDTIFEENNIIHPLKSLLSGFEDLIRINIPEAIKGDTLVELRHTIQPIDLINEQIMHREEYRNSDQDVSIYYRQIKKFDERLLRHIDSLIASLEELQSLF